MDSGRSHRVTTGSVRQVARSCTRRALIAWRLGRALRRWPECGLSRPLGVSLSYELLLTRRALSLRSLLRWSPDPDRLVGNAVTFKSRYCTSCESKPLGNGDAVLLSRTPVRRARTHVSNRHCPAYCEMKQAFLRWLRRNGLTEKYLRKSHHVILALKVCLQLHTRAQPRRTTHEYPKDSLSERGANRRQTPKLAVRPYT